MSDPGYLHGYRPEERDRLRRQARFLAPYVHEGLPFADCARVLEVGCGVGAQTELLLDSFPRLHVTGVDRSAQQIEAARLHVPPLFPKRCSFVEADAAQLGFGAGAFDGAFLCWILEHVVDPGSVLSEVRRVLVEGAPTICIEVLNATLFLHPQSPATAMYWRAYNDEQMAMGGDPFVGAKLGHHLSRAGFRQVRIEPRIFHFDSRAPDRKAAMVAYFAELLLSAAPALLRSGRVQPPLLGEVERELDRVASSPDGVFFFSSMCGRATV